MLLPCSYCLAPAASASRNHPGRSQLLFSAYVYTHASACVTPYFFLQMLPSFSQPTEECSVCIKSRCRSVNSKDANILGYKGSSWKQLIVQETAFAAYIDCNYWRNSQKPTISGAIVNRTYGTHKNLYIYLILLTIFGPIYYGPP